MATAATDTRRLTLFGKQAVGEDYDRPIEDSMSQLGWTYIKDKSPRLIDYVVGFQLIEKAGDENQKAMGAFAFKAGKLWLYVPIIYDAGKIKGYNILYVQNSNLTVPNKEKWTNHFISLQAGQSQDPGEPDPRTQSDLNLTTPSLLKLSTPPFFGKVAMVKRAGEEAYPVPTVPPVVADWIKPALPFLAWVKQAGIDEIVSSTLGKVDLVKELSLSSGRLKSAMDLHDRYPLMQDVLDRAAGENSSGRQLLQQAETAMVKRASLLAEKFHDPNSSILDASMKPRRQDWNVLGDPKFSKKASQAPHGVRMLTYASMDPSDAVFLTEDQRRTLVKQGYLLQDDRDETEFSDLVEQDYTLQGPEHSGLYEVLTSDGDFIEAMVFVGGRRPDGSESRGVTVVPVDKSKAMLTASARLVRIKVTPEMDDRKPLEDAIAAAKADSPFPSAGPGPGGPDDEPRSILVSPDGVAGVTGVFRAWDITEKGKRARASFEWSLDENKSHELGYHQERQNYMEGDDGLRGNIVIDDSLTQLDNRGGVLRVPSSFVRLTRPQSSSSSWSLGEEADLQRQLKKTASFKIYSDGDYEISTPYWTEKCNRREAHLWLAKSAGLSNEKAIEVLGQADTGKIKRYFIKQAAPYYPQNTGPGAPPWLPPISYNDPSYGGGGAAISPSQEFLSSMPPAAGPGINPSSAFMPGGLGTPAFSTASQMAQLAMSSGNEDLLDTSALLAIVSNMREDNVVTDESPVTMKFMNAMGRLLLKFYWNPKEFEEKFGKKDMPEFQTTVENGFDTSGDLAFFFKSKTVDPFGFENQDPSLDDSAGASGEG